MLSRAARASHFSFGKSNQNHLCRTLAGTMNLSRYPALLAVGGPARTRTSLCSDIRAFPPPPAAMLGSLYGTRARRAGAESKSRIKQSCSEPHALPPWLRRLCSWILRICFFSFPLWTYRAVKRAEHRKRTGEQGPHVRAHGCASSGRPPFAEERRVSIRLHRIGECPAQMVFGYFLPKEKVTRAIA